MNNNYTYLPADISEDVYIFPLVKANYIIPFFIVLIIAGILFFLFWAAGAVLIGFLILFIIPFLAALVLVLDLPGWFNKWRRFQKNKGFVDIMEFCDVAQVQTHDAALPFNNGMFVMVCEIKTGPWEYLTEGERLNRANTFRLALLEANREGIQVQIVLENHPETQLIPQPTSGRERTLDLLKSRQKYWEDNRQRYRTYYHIVLWGKNKKVLKEVAVDFVLQLESAGISHTFYAAESILSWMEYQKDPLPHLDEAVDPQLFSDRMKKRLVNRRSVGSSEQKEKSKVIKFVKTTTTKKPDKLKKGKIIPWPHKIIKQYPQINIPVPKMPSAKTIKLLRSTPDKFIFKQVEELEILAIWNTDGYKKADTALELAQFFKNGGKEVALLEFDTINPRLDLLFKIPSPSVNNCYNKLPMEIGAGLLTFGDQLTPEIAVQLLHKYKYEISYLPAGNTMGSLDTRIMTMPEYEELIERVSEKYQVIIIDCCTDLFNIATTAALRQCDGVVIPLFNLNHHTSELIRRLEKSGINVIKYLPEEQENTACL